MVNDRGNMDVENVLALKPQDEIVGLHNQVENAMARSLQNALRIGEILTQQKSKLNHGQFVPWIAENLPFGDRTARNYMLLHTRRDELKTARIAGLNAAYRLLSTPMMAGVTVEQDSNTEELSGLSPAERFEAACSKFKNWAFFRKQAASKATLEELEAGIEKNLPGAITGARSFIEIRDKKLWQVAYSSFNEFCLAKTGLPAEFIDALSALTMSFAGDSPR